MPSGPVLSSPQVGSSPAEPVAVPVSAASPTPASPASNRAGTPSGEGKGLSMSRLVILNLHGNVEALNDLKIASGFQWLGERFSSHTI